MKRIDRREIEGFTRRLCEEHGLAPWQVRCYQRPAYEPYDPEKGGAKGGKDPNIYIQHGGALEPIHEVSQLVKSVSGALFCRVYFNPAEGLGAADEEALRLRVKEFYEAHRHGGAEAGVSRVLWGRGRVQRAQRAGRAGFYQSLLEGSGGRGRGHSPRGLP